VVQPPIPPRFPSRRPFSGPIMLMVLNFAQTVPLLLWVPWGSPLRLMIPFGSLPFSSRFFEWPPLLVKFLPGTLHPSRTRSVCLSFPPPDSRTQYVPPLGLGRGLGGGGWVGGRACCWGVLFCLVLSEQIPFVLISNFPRKSNSGWFLLTGFP